MSDNPAPARSSSANKIDLDKMSVEELTALRDAVEKKRDEKINIERDAVVKEAREKLARLGLSVESVFLREGMTPRPASKASGQGGSLPVKYRGPNGETWSERGRLPKWLAALEAQGRSRDEFKV